MAGHCPVEWILPSPLFSQGRHVKTGQLAAIKVMDVTEVCSLTQGGGQAVQGAPREGGREEDGLLCPGPRVAVHLSSSQCCPRGGSEGRGCDPA